MNAAALFRGGLDVGDTKHMMSVASQAILLNPTQGAMQKLSELHATSDSLNMFSLALATSFIPLPYQPVILHLLARTHLSANKRTV